MLAISMRPIDSAQFRTTDCGGSCGWRKRNVSGSVTLTEISNAHRKARNGRRKNDGIKLPRRVSDMLETTQDFMMGVRQQQPVDGGVYRD
ncbi:MAG: hypothetical protein QG577_1470 [Thermodesulfobacteriota bacterium]|nr:hypothetical protein [Thermodesulfobacteriota bacterium]